MPSIASFINEYKQKDGHATKRRIQHIQTESDFQINTEDRSLRPLVKDKKQIEKMLREGEKDIYRCKPGDATPVEDKLNMSSLSASGKATISKLNYRRHSELPTMNPYIFNTFNT